MQEPVRQRALRAGLIVLCLLSGAAAPPMPRPRDLSHLLHAPEIPAHQSESGAPTPSDTRPLPEPLSVAVAVAAATVPPPAPAAEASGQSQKDVFANPIAMAPPPTVGETGAIKTGLDGAAGEIVTYVRLLSLGALAVVVIVLGQSALSFVQMRAMRRSFAGAGNAADVASAAVRAAQLSSESHQLSERAWMATKDPIWSYSTYMKDGVQTEGVFFIVRWTNGGRTPAMNCNISTAQKAVWLKDGDTMPLFQPSSAATQAGGPVAPGGLIAGGPFILEAQPLDGLRQKKVRVYFWALLRYSDAFRSDVTRETETCLEVVHAGVVENREGAKTDRFELVARGPQNRAT